MQATKIAKRWLPPALLEHLKPMLGRGVYFSGRYDNWEAASTHASGYEASLILERVKEATLKVKSGEAKYERDSVLFNRVEHSFPVLAGLLRAALADDNRLSVLDFGGSLGSSYFQCRDFLSDISALKWNIVEQPHFVDCGHAHFETDELRFFYTISECIAQTKPNVALLSSVLQYLTEPYKVLGELMDAGIPYIVIDRTPFSNNEADRITMQHVPPTIYKSSLPFRIYGKEFFLNSFRDRYNVTAQFGSCDGSAVVNCLEFSFGGMILRKI